MKLLMVICLFNKRGSMAKGQDGSVAPKERINISFKPAGADKNEEVELPPKILVMGEFEGENAPDYKEGKTFSVDTILMKL